MNEKYIPSREELNKAEEILKIPENEELKKMSEDREKDYNLEAERNNLSLSLIKDGARLHLSPEQLEQAQDMNIEMDEEEEREAKKRIVSRLDNGNEIKNFWYDQETGQHWGRLFAFKNKIDASIYEMETYIKYFNPEKKGITSFSGEIVSGYSLEQVSKSEFIRNIMKVEKGKKRYTHSDYEYRDFDIDTDGRHWTGCSATAAKLNEEGLFRKDKLSPKLRKKYGITPYLYQADRKKIGYRTISRLIANSLENGQLKKERERAAIRGGAQIQLCFEEVRRIFSEEFPELVESNNSSQAELHQETNDDAEN
ncbi:MAG: hypothetical protein AAB487_00010 [Patescibacteria group bacterium]